MNNNILIVIAILAILFFIKVMTLLYKEFKRLRNIEIEFDTIVNDFQINLKKLLDKGYELNWGDGAINEPYFKVLSRNKENVRDIVVLCIGHNPVYFYGIESYSA